MNIDEVDNLPAGKTPEIPIREKKGNKNRIIGISLFVLIIVIFLVFKPRIGGDAKDQTVSSFKTVTVGNQVWMAENLNVGFFTNGDLIPEARTADEWQKAGEREKPAWCYYENDTANGEIYGRLYNWYAVNDPRGLAPAGWHVPTDEEWTALTGYLGGVEVAGGKIKETGTTHWTTPNIAATNESGFTALPGGYRTFLGTFKFVANYSGWWSSTEYSAALACTRDANYNYCVVGRYIDKKPAGFAVRCVKD